MKQLLRNLNSWYSFLHIHSILNNLVSKYSAAYFPFAPKSTKRPLSVNEGYGFVVTQEFVDLFPRLSSAFDKGFQEPKIIEGVETKTADDKKKKRAKRKVSSAKNEAVELYAVEKAVKQFCSENNLKEKIIGGLMWRIL